MDCAESRAGRVISCPAFVQLVGRRSWLLMSTAKKKLNFVQIIPQAIAFPHPHNIPCEILYIYKYICSFKKCQVQVNALETTSAPCSNHPTPPSLTMPTPRTTATHPTQSPSIERSPFTQTCTQNATPCTHRNQCTRNIYKKSLGTKKFTAPTIRPQRVVVFQLRVG